MVHENALDALYTFRAAVYAQWLMEYKAAGEAYDREMKKAWDILEAARLVAREKRNRLYKEIERAEQIPLSVNLPEGK